MDFPDKNDTAVEVLHIKNLVCDWCIKVVGDEITSLGFKIQFIELGKVGLKSSVNNDEVVLIAKALEENGFKLLNDKKSRIVSKIKIEVIKYIHMGETIPEKVNFSTYLSEKIGMDYSYLSTLFSSAVGLTIEKFIILHKIERVKELLIYDELSLKEISYQLEYSSVQYLSNQFKQTTGLTPTEYKKLEKSERQTLDNLLKPKIL